MAYPSNEDNKTLINALPTVNPYPGSKVTETQNSFIAFFIYHNNLISFLKI